MRYVLLILLMTLEACNSVTPVLTSVAVCPTNRVESLDYQRALSASIKSHPLDGPVLSDVLDQERMRCETARCRGDNSKVCREAVDE